MKTKKSNILISIFMTILGFALDGFAWSTTIVHPLSTICLLLGLGLFFGGILLLLLTLTSK
jgi:hypothetical protein